MMKMRSSSTCRREWKRRRRRRRRGKKKRKRRRHSHLETAWIRENTSWCTSRTITTRMSCSRRIIGSTSTIPPTETPPTTPSGSRSSDNSSPTRSTPFNESTGGGSSSSVRVCSRPAVAHLNPFPSKLYAALRLLLLLLSVAAAESRSVEPFIMSIGWREEPVSLFASDD